MIKQIIIEALIKPWSLITMAIFIVIRIIYLKKNNKKIIIYKELLIMLLIIYLFSLHYILTFKSMKYSNNFLPFSEIFRYSLNSKLFYKNVVGNLVIFIPFGIYISYYLKIKKTLTITIFSAISSLVIEIIQSLIGRVFDIDDIILNTLGGIIGLIILKITFKIIDIFPTFLKNPIIYNIIIISLLSIFIIYLI